MTNQPEFQDIEAAARRLDGIAVRTPLLESILLNRHVGGRLLLKAESLQRTGSFKFRGAWNRVSLIAESEREKGVVAYSSGNHAQGVAAAAHILGIEATIIMPNTAPAIKKSNTRAYGAKVIEYDIDRESREKIGAEICRRTGATLVRPYDDSRVVAGQGTAGLEIVSDLIARQFTPDQILIPCGGGGLIAGISIAVHETFPDCRIYSVEPEGFDDTSRSLEARRRLGNPLGGRSICDAIMTPEPGELTFPINLEHLAAGVCVTDKQVLAGMRCAFEHFKIVVEPGGAVALAAAIAGSVPLENRCTVVVCSGGNVDADLYRRCLDDR
ncbi:MAG: threonine/serine dehydratase [Proteobacteria bacterium]|nr:MAG: threonine/serine dehydratase [Pseudomonadota bacterium]